MLVARVPVGNMKEKANWKLYPRATTEGMRKQLGEVKKRMCRAEGAYGIALGWKGRRGLNGMSWARG